MTTHLCSARHIIILILFLKFTLSSFQVALYAGAAYAVQVGAFQEKERAEKLAQELKSKGFPAYVVNFGDGFARVWVGNFSNRFSVKSLAGKLTAMGYPAVIKSKGKESPVPKPQTKKETKKKRNIKNVKKLATSIQVKSTTNKEEASSVKRKLADKGFFAYILVVKSGAQLTYKVRVSPLDGKTVEDTGAMLEKMGYDVEYVE